MAFVSVLQFKNNSKERFISIRKVGDRSWIAYISSSISRNHPSANIEVDVSERKIRVICGDGGHMKFNKAGSLPIPSLVVNSILGDEGNTRRIKLTKQDDGWFYGEF